MKKILLVIFSFFILCKTVNASYIVYDMDNNRVLKEINMNEKHLVASTSKIMTAIVAIENSNLDSKVIVTKDILSAVGSSIYLEIGEKISMKDLLYGMMLRSGNDAATMIAIHVSGSMEKFTEKMNEYAKKIAEKMLDIIEKNKDQYHKKLQDAIYNHILFDYNYNKKLN